MKPPIHLLGIGADGLEGLSGRSKAILDQANFLAGGRRHLELVASATAEKLTITANLADLAARLSARGEAERCVVLASGDPLFYGIGSYLREHLPGEEILIEPAISSAQLAFARAGIPWRDAKIASIHGRPFAETLRPLLGEPLIGLFTENGESPAKVAKFFLDHDLNDYRAILGENLGTSSENIFRSDFNAIINKVFSDLNFLILVRDLPRVEPEPVGIIAADHRFSQPETGPILLTHEDLRAIVMNRFVDLPAGPLWDVGAGLGGVSVDLARRFRSREVIGIERSGDQLEFLRQNRLRFAAHNLRIREGEAPDALIDLQPPAGIFLGGSGGRLDAILSHLIEHLLPSGVLVANFVALENFTKCLGRLREEGWPVQVDQIQVSQGRKLAGLTTFVPLRPVWVVKAVKPR